jgi:hypothetical protein
MNLKYLLLSIVPELNGSYFSFAYIDSYIRVYITRFVIK